MDVNHLDYPRADDVKILYADSWWDGPLSGMCQYNGESLYFNYIGGDDLYLYIACRLTPDQLQSEAERHNDFVKYVGDHYCFTEDGSRNIKPPSEWHQFYDKYKDDPVSYYDESKIVIWFDSDSINNTDILGFIKRD